jgi:asparagine synthase (glutamine-hydrolysing)
MSAQAGTWNFDGKPADQSLLLRLGSEMAKHAPDGQKVHICGALGMLFRPSHTTLESRLEQQPYLSSLKALITWDGRLDNRDEVRDMLGHEAASLQTDVDIAAASFDRWGTQCFANLIGDWALSIFDQQTNRLILAKDHLGVRHLYYVLTAQGIVWCTHLTALIVACKTPFTINSDYVAGYLLSYPSVHCTPFCEIHPVPAGGFVTVSPVSASTQHYWKLDLRNEIRYKTDGDYEQHFRHLFRQAVRRRLRADRTIVAELSGGIDSSSIVSMADHIIGSGEAGNVQLETLSLYDSRVSSADEREFVAIVERQRGCKGLHVDIAEYGDDFFCIDSGHVDAIPGPSTHLQGVRQRVFGLLRDRDSRVVLSGLGAEEVLATMLKPGAQLADSLAEVKLLRLIRDVSAWTSGSKEHWWLFLSEALRVLIDPYIPARFRKQQKTKSWIHTEFVQRHRHTYTRIPCEDTSTPRLPTRREYAETFNLLKCRLAFFRSQPLVCEERRYPFLDLNLVQFAAAVPATQLLRPGERRSLMRRALHEIVPSNILWRQTKGGGSPSLAQSFLDNWTPFEQLFRSPSSSSLGFTNSDDLQKRLGAARTGTLADVAYVSKALYLELWLRALIHHGILRSRSDDSILHLQGDEVRSTEGVITQPIPKEHSLEVMP